MPRDTDDEIAEMNWRDREAKRASKCQCEDLPMYCPGPANCPYSGCDDEDEESEGDEE